MADNRHTTEPGLMSLIGKRAILLCANYIYEGKIVDVLATEVHLEDAAIVYETGEWSARKYKDSQKLPMRVCHVTLQSIESYGESNAAR